MSSPLQKLVLIQSGYIGAAAGLILVAPRLAPLLIGLLALSYLVADIGMPGPTQITASRFVGPVSLTMAGLTVYALLSALWAASVPAAVQSGGQLLLSLTAAVYLCDAIPRRFAALDQADRRRYLRAVPIGFAIGLVFLLEEFLSGHRIMLAMLGAWPALAGVGRKGLVYSDATLASMHGFYVNQNVAALVLMAPPALAAATLWLPASSRTTATGLGGVLLAITVFASDSETAKLACVVGVLTWLAA